MLLLLGVGYHFALEANDGQTVGKRPYGMRVVSLDGGRPSPGAVAMRSVLRIVDQRPVCYVSGLVSMVRTGPARRQRIGDVAAGTMVIAPSSLRSLVLQSQSERFTGQPGHAYQTLFAAGVACRR